MAAPEEKGEYLTLASFQREKHLLVVPHRKVVFAISGMFRIFSKCYPRLQSELCRSALQLIPGAGSDKTGLANITRNIRAPKPFLTSFFS
jgi:hypothetical protein